MVPKEITIQPGLVYLYLARAKAGGIATVVEIAVVSSVCFVALKIRRTSKRARERSTLMIKRTASVARPGPPVLTSSTRDEACTEGSIAHVCWGRTGFSTQVKADSASRSPPLRNWRDAWACALSPNSGRSSRLSTNPHAPAPVFLSSVLHSARS
jgi:hypothetical protein